MDEELRLQDRLVLRCAGGDDCPVFPVGTRLTIICKMQEAIEEVHNILFKSVTELLLKFLKSDKNKMICTDVDAAEIRKAHLRFVRGCRLPVEALETAAKELKKRSSFWEEEEMIELRLTEGKLVRESLLGLCALLREYLTLFCRESIIRGFQCKHVIDMLVNKLCTQVMEQDKLLDSIAADLIGIKKQKPESTARFKTQPKLEHFEFIEPPMESIEFSSRPKRSVSEGGLKSANINRMESITRLEREINIREAKQLKIELLWPSRSVQEFADCDEFERDVFARSLVNDIDVEQTIDDTVHELEVSLAPHPAQELLDKLCRQREDLLVEIQTNEEQRRKFLKAKDTVGEERWQRAQNNAERRDELEQLEKLERRVLAVQIGVTPD